MCLSAWHTITNFEDVERNSTLYSTDTTPIIRYVDFTLKFDVVVELNNIGPTCSIFVLLNNQCKRYYAKMAIDITSICCGTLAQTDAFAFMYFLSL